MHEGLIAHVLPADLAVSIDEEGPVERLSFKFIVSSECLESDLSFIGNEHEGERILAVSVLESLGQAVGGVRADGDDLDPSFAILLGYWRESRELVHAMDTAAPKEIDYKDRLSGELRRGDDLAICLGKLPVW